MPYAPGIQNISGQLAAQGISAGGQAYANAINSVGGSVMDFIKREDERTKTVGAIRSFLNDPYYQQQVSKDPELSSLGEKIKAGKGSFNEVQQFLGSLTTAGHMRDQQMKQQQLDATLAYNTALTESAKANKAATEAATAERVRGNQIADQLFKTINELDDLEKLKNTTGFTTFEQEDRYSKLSDNPLITAVRQGKEVGLDPIASIKVFQNEDSMRQRADLARMADETRRLASENTALKNVKFNAGDKRTFTIDGKQINAEWDGKEFVDAKTGAPIYTTVETSDMMGNRSSIRGQLNPEVASFYGIRSTRQMPKPGALPPAGGGPAYEEVPSPGEKPGAGKEKTDMGKATQTRYPVPNRDAVTHLLQNPDLSSQFDELFGPGAAARVMMEQGNLMKGVSTTNSGGVELSNLSQFLPR
jgi:hypothetical protein